MPKNKVATANRDKIDVVLIENTLASAEVSLFGGQVLSYVPKRDNRERLWLSKNAQFDRAKPIRGGIPICWPWFANRHGKSDQNLPAHGYLRQQNWQMRQLISNDQGSEITLVPKTTEGFGFNGVANVHLIINVGEHLSVSLRTRNVGSEAFAFTAALHSYFAVEDIRRTRLIGLSGDYEDSLQQGKICPTPSPYIFHQETDRIHLTQTENLRVESKQQTTQICSFGHDSLVVWNPWREKSQTIADMDDSGYTNMLCIETAITRGLTLAPCEDHTLVQRIY